MTRPANENAPGAPAAPAPAPELEEEGLPEGLFDDDDEPEPELGDGGAGDESNPLDGDEPELGDDQGAAAAAGEEPKPGEDDPSQAADDDTYSKLRLKAAEKLRELETRERELAPQLGRIKKWEAIARDWETDQVEALRTQLAVMRGTDDSEAIDGALHELYNELSAYFLGDDAPPEMREEKRYREFRRKLAAQERELAQTRQAAEQARAREQALAVEAQMSREAGQVLATAADQYPFLIGKTEELAAQGSSPAAEVVELIKADWDAQRKAGVKQPKQLSYGEAAAKLEKYLADELERAHALYSRIRGSTPSSNRAPSSNRPGEQPSRKRTSPGAPSTVPDTSSDEEFDKMAVNGMFTDD